MIKFLPLLFSCLLLFGNTFAQTAQDTLPVAKDTNTGRPKQEPGITAGEKPRDTGLRRHDSVKRIHAPRLAPLQTPVVHPDSSIIPKAPSVTDSLHARKDTQTRSVDTLSAAAPVHSSTGSAGGISLPLWQAVLSSNDYINFTGKPVVELEMIHRAESRDSLFYLLIGILFYFALVRIFYEKYFGHLITLFFRASIRQQQIREQVLQTPLPSLMLNGLFIITGGLYACYLLRFYQFGVELNFWLLYFYCMLSLGLIYLVKFLVLKFCGWVFSISRATDTYIFVVFLVNKMLGIFLLPFLILITFSGPAAKEIYITISIVMIFVFLCYRILASFRPIRNEIKLTPFHFFLYLCAFEIAPLLLIYKVLLTYLEKGS